MAKLLAVFTHHHDSTKVPWRCFVESEAEALEQALLAEWQCVLREPAADVLARAKNANENGVEGVRTYDEGYEDGDDSEDEDVCVWYSAEKPGEPLVLGVGKGESLNDTNKRDNVWIHLEEWAPDPAKQAELLSLSKEELVQRLLEVEAVR